MKTEIIKNKEGEILTTKDGIQLTDHAFEVGDVFVPKTGFLILDKKSKFEKYKVVANVKEANGTSHEEVFVTLTPAQVKVFQNAVSEGVELNQIKWTTYKYHSNEYDVDCVGIAYKERKEAITLE